MSSRSNPNKPATTTSKAQQSKAERTAARTAKAQEKAARTAVAAKVAAGKAARTVAALDRLLARRAQAGHAGAFAGRQGLAKAFVPNEAVRKTLAVEFPKLAPMMAERRIIIDPKTGAILVDKTGKVNKEGEFNGVNLFGFKTAKYPQGEKSLARGAIDVHNHAFLPDSYPTINDWDYEEASGRVKPQSIMALTEAGVAGVRPKGGTWPSYPTTIKPALDRHFAALDKAMVAAARSRSTSPQVRAALRGMTEGELTHLAWRQAAREHGLIYTRVPWQTAAGARGVTRAKRKQQNV